MMRFLFIILLLTALLRQCSGDYKTYEGSLSLYGAEPFVQLALMTADDERFFLDADRETLDKLWKENQGRIKIEGELYEDEWYGRPHDFIRIKKWEWIED